MIRSGTGWLLALVAGIAIVSAPIEDIVEAKTIQEMEVVATRGIWELRHVKDEFTDEKSCVIVVIANYDIRVSTSRLFINYSTHGGAQGYQFRIDDGPVSGMQLPSEVDRRMGVIELEGRTFDKLLRAKRLRVQTLTLISGLENADINLVGLAELYLDMQKLCPGG